MSDSDRPKFITNKNLQDGEWFVLSELASSLPGMHRFQMARSGSKVALNVYVSAQGGTCIPDIFSIRHLLGFTIVSLN